MHAGGCRKHNFWMVRVKSIKNYMFEILTSRAIDRYINGSHWGGLQFVSGKIPWNFKYVIGILS